MNHRYEHDPQPGELPEELKPKQKLDPVSEAIEKEFANTKFARGGGACFECCDYEGMYTDLLSFAHRIATLSYARGVEDSAKTLDNMGDRYDLDYRKDAYSAAAAAIRSLIPNEKKV